MSSVKKDLKQFERIDDAGKTREEKLDDFLLLLSESELESDGLYRFYKRQKYIRFIIAIAGMLCILVGVAILFVPLPKTLEVKTLWYFNPKDGVTVSDLIGLFTIFTGIVLLMKPLLTREKD